MQIQKIKEKLESIELPDGFCYPESFNQFLATTADLQGFLEPWGFAADADSDLRYGSQCGHRLVQFAQAWHEDMIACFLVGTGSNRRS